MQNAFNNTSIEDFYIDANGEDPTNALLLSKIDIKIESNAFTNNENRNSITYSFITKKSEISKNLFDMSVYQMIKKTKFKQIMKTKI